MFSEFFDTYNLFVYELEPITPRPEASAVEQPEAIKPVPLEEHPHWIRLRVAMMHALWPFAEARAAVVRAIEDLEALPVTT